MWYLNCFSLCNEIAAILVVIKWSWGGGHFQPRVPSTIHQPSSAYTKDGKENCDLLQLFLASNQIHITFSGQIRQLPRIDDRRFAERHRDVKSPKKIARIRGELDRRSWSGEIGAT